MASRVYLGIKGSVVALDRATGAEIWATHLKGADFVNLLVDGNQILASTKGEMFCLDAQTGTPLWNNPLRGRGLGLITIATAAGSTPLSPLESKRQRDAAAAAATVAATA